MPRPRQNRSAYTELAAVSWSFGWPIAAGVMLGYWIDQKLGTSPAASLVLGLGALVAAAWRMVDLSRQEAREHKREHEEDGDGR